MKKEFKVALFSEALGQVTQFLPVREVLSFPSNDMGRTWWQDEEGETYSTYDLLSVCFA